MARTAQHARRVRAAIPPPMAVAALAAVLLVTWQAPGNTARAAPGTPVSAATGAPSARQERALELSGEGVTLYRAGRYAEALSLFEAAHELLPDPNLLFNIARCHEQLGRDEEAIHYLERFASTEGLAPEDRDRAQRHLQRLRARSRVRTGDALGSAPCARAIPPRRSHALEWSLIGSGAALVAMGSVFGGLALASDAAYADADSLADRLLLRDEAQERALVADVTLGIGAAALATGLVLLLALDDEDAASDNATVDTVPTARPFVAPTFGDGNAGALIGVQF